MMGLDTNVLVRYIMQDDAGQSPLANRLIESLSAAEPGFVPIIVIVELAGVLSFAYELSRGQLVEAFEGLLRTKELVVERAELVWKAIRCFQSANTDFANCMIAESARASGCGRIMTFDRGAAKNGGMTLIV
jgi:predicted nucleic-acid-binding protein